jgi:hypothetical protein
MERAPRSPSHQWKCLASTLAHDPPVGAPGPRLAAQHTVLMVWFLMRVGHRRVAGPPAPALTGAAHCVVPELLDGRVDQLVIA